MAFTSSFGPFIRVLRERSKEYLVALPDVIPDDLDLRPGAYSATIEIRQKDGNLSSETTRAAVLPRDVGFDGSEIAPEFLLVISKSVGLDDIDLVKISDLEFVNDNYVIKVE